MPYFFCFRLIGGMSSIGPFYAIFFCFRLIGGMSSIDSFYAIFFLFQINWWQSSIDPFYAIFFLFQINWWHEFNRAFLCHIFSVSEELVACVQRFHGCALHGGVYLSCDGCHKLPTQRLS